MAQRVGRFLVSQQRDTKRQERSALFRAMGVASVCGLDLALSVLAGVLLGHYLDGQAHTAPLLLIIGLFLGLIAGFYTAYRIIAPVVRSM